jgi:phosphotransferase system enzyme I (PtsI)
MLLHDETLTGATKHWIRERHYNAEWALSAQLEVLARQFDEMEDEYRASARPTSSRWSSGCSACWRARRRRLAPGDAGRRAQADADADPLVLVANDISPADMLQWKGGLFLGFVTDVGGKTSHTAIVARSMDIPAVVGGARGRAG